MSARSPTSATSPARAATRTFGREALAAALSTAEIAYVHLRGLGGRRRERPGSRHRAIEVAALRAYADHMESDEFNADLVRLHAAALEHPTAYMCAESPWWRCHRRLLSDRLLVYGWEVVHILGPGKSEPHRLWELARVDDDRLVYDVGALPLRRPEGYVECDHRRSS